MPVLRHPSSWLAAGLVALLLGALPACDLGDDAPSAWRMCNSSSDCPPGLTCASGPGWCIDPTTIKSPMAVQLTPPTGTQLITDQRSSVNVWKDNQFSASMKPALVVKGIVHDAGNPLPSGIPSQLVAVTEGDVPGTTLRSEVEVGSTLQEGGIGFQLPVIADRLYVVSVFPQDARRPPHHVARKFREGDAFLDIALPPPEDYPSVCGRLTDGRDADKDGVPDSLHGVRVQALEVRPAGDTSPLPLRTSTVAVTRPADEYEEDATSKCPTGHFQLRFPAEKAEYVLQLQPASTDAGVEPAIIPRLSVDPAVQTIKIAGLLGEVAPSLQTITVATAPPVTASLTVQGKEPGGHAVPIKGATVTLEGQVEQGVFTAHGTTNESGLWTGKVLPGTYALLIVPPKEGPFARSTQSVTLDAEAPTLTVKTGRRTKVTGTVTGFDGRSVADVSVSALQLDDDGELAVGSGDVMFATKSGGAGAFELWVDPGRYAFLLSPPEGLGYPRHIERSVPLVSGAELALDLELPAPYLVHGVITTSTGEPAADVTIEFYDLTGEGAPGGDPHPNLDKLSRLGVGTTDASGAYRALISTESL